MDNNKKKSERKKDNNIELLFLIFWTFFKISPVSFGGGYAMIPIIEKEMVQKHKWLKTEEVGDVFALAQSAPGAIALNAAIFIGYRLSGTIGAIVALVGVLLPTFIIMIFLTIFFMSVQSSPKIEAAFISIRTTIVALIVYAAYKIGKEAIIDIASVLIALSTLCTLYFFHNVIHPVLLIIGGAVLGIVIVFIRAKLGISTTNKQEKKEVPIDYMI